KDAASAASLDGRQGAASTGKGGGEEMKRILWMAALLATAGLGAAGCDRGDDSYGRDSGRSEGAGPELRQPSRSVSQPSGSSSGSMDRSGSLDRSGSSSSPSSIDRGSSQGSGSDFRSGSSGTSGSSSGTSGSSGSTSGSSSDIRSGGSSSSGGSS